MKLTDGQSDVILAVRSGRAIRFHEQDVRPMGKNRRRSARYHTGRRSGQGGRYGYDERSEQVAIGCFLEKGYGKRSAIDEYRITKRGGKGVKTLNVTTKTGVLVSIQKVADPDDLMIINTSGIMIRMPVADLRVMGRATQGVRLIRLNGDDSIASVGKVENDLIEEELEAQKGEGTLDQSDSISSHDISAKSNGSGE